MYAEKAMRNAGLEDSSIGVRIGGRNINNLRYADDTTLLAESGKNLEDLVLLVKKESEKFGLYLNVKKTKIMPTAATTNINIKIEVVDDFIFLGSKINRDGPTGHRKDQHRHIHDYEISARHTVLFRKNYEADSNICLRVFPPISHWRA
ncbi:Hypothetical predicted protein [Octopus vulgaris]|uniref:Reverse transcriptase domain-containing protein n=1 Tax=Octopus vulgaris TaxID=6645 RepID=A0AA36BJD6_OCTVU|nr:Hypothetical predicted protein [Octopus vulgaris]